MNVKSALFTIKMALSRSALMVVLAQSRKEVNADKAIQFSKLEVRNYAKQSEIRDFFTVESLDDSEDEDLIPCSPEALRSQLRQYIVPRHQEQFEFDALSSPSPGKSSVNFRERESNTKLIRKYCSLFTRSC